MTHEEAILNRARALAHVEFGNIAPENVVKVLVRMVAASASGVSAGFLRLHPPDGQKDLDLDDHKPL